jgi:hypothetical protein
MEIRSIRNVTFATFVGTVYRRKRDNPLIGFMEGLMFVAGIFDVENIARIAPNAKLELFTPMSAYGPRVGKQMDWVIEQLNNDRDSRRAVMVLAKNFEKLENRPCTTSLQFRIQGNLLDTIVSMRSSDAVYGLPYDLIQFGMMAMVIADATNTFTSSLIINIGDAHIYKATQHLAQDIEPWSFNLPLKRQDGFWWRNWAKEQIPKLNKDTMYDMFHYRKGREYEARPF